MLCQAQVACRKGAPYAAGNTAHGLLPDKATAPVEFLKLQDKQLLLTKQESSAAE